VYKRQAQELVIEADIHDVQFKEIEGERFAATIRAWWSPKTHEVEFRGGQEDGRVMTVNGWPEEVP